MCGRFTSTSGVGQLASLFDVAEVRTEPLPPRWNVAPSLPVYAVAQVGRGGAAGTRRALGTLRWGLVPSWAGGPEVATRLVNARAEGIEAKPSFRAAFARRRCLLPADSFYEWQRSGPGSPKIAYVVARTDGMPMALAGIWEVWRDRTDPGAPPLRTAAVVTTAANSLMSTIHDRMPVVIEPGDWDDWLDPRSEPAVLRSLMVPAADGVLDTYAVGPAVNNARNEGPRLVEPLVTRSGAV